LRLALALAFCVLAQAAGAVEIAGAAFAPRAAIGGEETVLNGAGLRRIFFFKAYAIGLYLPRSANSTEQALAERGPKRLRIVLMRDLKAEQIANTLETGLRRNLTEAEFKALGSRIESLRIAVNAYGIAHSGSAIHFDWMPASDMTRLTVNGEARSGDFPGEDFFHAVLKVWLGPSVNDSGLRAKLLGREDG